FQMKLLCRQQRESFPQIEAGLRSEHRKRPSAGAIFPRRALIENEPEKIVILAHTFPLHSSLRTPPLPRQNHWKLAWIGRGRYARLRATRRRHICRRDRARRFD